MNSKLPNLSRMNGTEAINWYTKELTKVFNVKNRVAGTYSDEYKDALLSWKQRLNKKLIAERTAIVGECSIKNKK